MNPELLNYELSRAEISGFLAGITSDNKAVMLLECRHSTESPLVLEIKKDDAVLCRLEGFMTPVLNMQHGYCELNCTLCGQVCPSGAIERITIAQKHGIPNSKPIKIGTAFIDKNRCILWTTASNCLVCQEVCPTSPKAIMDDEYTTMHNHQKITTRRPLVNPKLCIGCGLCQYECPVHDTPAIRVTALNESRADSNFFL